MSSFDVGQCRFVLLRPSECNKEPELFRSAFETWNDIWTKTMSELQPEMKLHSDAFTRQHEIISLFQETRCFGMLLLRFVDFSHFPWQTDSYFSRWQESDIKTLLAHGKRILIPSYMTVLPEYRKSLTGLNFRELLMDLMIKRFLDSDSDAIAAICRREKRVHEAAYIMGAVAIREDIPFYNPEDRVDLQVFFRHKVKLSSDPLVREWSDKLMPIKGEFSYAA